MVEPRLLRRIIKYHRALPGLAPHAHCYTINKADLLGILQPQDLGLEATELPDPIILIARPSSREIKSRTESEVLTRLWRCVFHGRVHLAIEGKIARGELDDARIRQRIEAIGLTEFDEIRSILRQDDLIFPPGTDCQVYEEFAAVYLELRHFTPHLLTTTFPGLSALGLVDEALAQDVDHGRLLIQGMLEGVTTGLGPTGTVIPDEPVSIPRVYRSEVREVSSKSNERLLRRADAAKQKGDDVKAALLCAIATGALSPERKSRAQAGLLKACEDLGKRLTTALAWPEDSKHNPPWATLFAALAKRAASESRWLTYGIEARVLATIQRAIVAVEKQPRAVDPAAWILSLGKRPAIRALPATKELRLARLLRNATARAHHIRLAPWEQKPIAHAIMLAQNRAEQLARCALRPLIQATLDKVGLRATNTPERLASNKLIEELLDHALDAGFISFSQLRDAISRNQLKLDDLSGAKELWHGDALIQADAHLATQLDGVYRRGDVYLRWMQKATSLPLGTRVGRAITLYALLPVGAAFIVLEGLGHIVGPLMGWLGRTPPAMITSTSLLVTIGLMFGLLHSQPFRAFAMQVLEIVGVVLAWVFFRLPRAIISLPLVRRWLAKPAVRLVLRRIVVPTLFAVAAFFIAPFEQVDWLLSLAVSLSTFVVVSLLAGTRIGRTIEDYVIEQIVPTWQVLSRQWIPGLLKGIVKVFAAAMDLLQRGIFRIDEVLRYQQGNHRAITIVKASVGLVWAIMAYVLRVYITLLVEPELNPLKHFPIITVCHKLFLPVTPQVLRAMQVPLTAAFGTIVGGAIAGVTVFLLPSISGFFAWEFKENYKLYHATLPDLLPPSRIGHHGETMRGLLVPGFHSGTLPKLYQRLRKAAAREHEQSASPIARIADGKSDLGAGKFRKGIAQVQEAIRRFVQRELLAYLEACPRWTMGRISIGDIELSSHRIRIQLFCEKLSPLACDITFEQTAGLIIAGMPSPGFVGMLQRLSKEQTTLFENALAGFYQQAEVDLVREQIQAELGVSTHYELAEDGLITWPDSSYRTEFVYRVDVRKPKTLAPKIKGVRPSMPAKTLDTRRILFRHQTISRLSWTSAWVAAQDTVADIPRLLSGSSILPPPILPHQNNAQITPPQTPSAPSLPSANHAVATMPAETKNTGVSTTKTLVLDPVQRTIVQPQEHGATGQTHEPQAPLADGTLLQVPISDQLREKHENAMKLPRNIAYLDTIIGSPPRDSDE